MSDHAVDVTPILEAVGLRIRELLGARSMKIEQEQLYQVARQMVLGELDKRGMANLGIDVPWLVGQIIARTELRWTDHDVLAMQKQIAQLEAENAALRERQNAAEGVMSAFSQALLSNLAHVGNTLYTVNTMLDILIDGGRVDEANLRAVQGIITSALAGIIPLIQKKDQT